MCVCRQHFDRIIGIEKEEERDESSLLTRCRLSMTQKIQVCY